MLAVRWGTDRMRGDRVKLWRTIMQRRVPEEENPLLLADEETCVAFIKEETLTMQIQTFGYTSEFTCGDRIGPILERFIGKFSGVYFHISTYGESACLEIWGRFVSPDYRLYEKFAGPVGSTHRMKNGSQLRFVTTFREGGMDVKMSPPDG
jgi:hypothetical protein